MRFSLGLFGALLSMQALADVTVKTKIHDIEAGSKIGEETLIFLSTGQVARLSQNKIALLEVLNEFKGTDQWLELHLNDDREVIGVKEIEGKELNYAPKLMNEAPSSYVPSTLGSLAWAHTYFKSMRTGAKEKSECYDRAHVWAYDWFRAKKYYSSKIFIFFTRKYIREFKFEWWFHVSPYVHVIENGKITERVMDFKYSRGPLHIRNWTNIFMKNDAYCPVVKNYSQYANYPESGSCFLMKKPMYYYQPIDMENEELYGTPKKFWIDWEVKNAYSLGFGIKVE